MQSLILLLLAAGGAGPALTDATAKVVVGLLQLFTTGGILGVVVAVVYHVAVSRAGIEHLKRSVLAELAQLREENTRNAERLEAALERHIGATTEHRLDSERWKAETEIALALLRQRVTVLETTDRLEDFVPLNTEAA